MTVPGDVSSLNLKEQNSSVSEDSKPQLHKQEVIMMEDRTREEEQNKKEEPAKEDETEEALVQQQQQLHQQQQQQPKSSSLNNGVNYPRRDYNNKKRNFAPNNRYNHNNYNARRTNNNRYYSNNNLSRYHNSNDGNVDNVPPNYPYFYYYPPPNMYYQPMPLHQHQYPPHPSQLTPTTRRSYSDHSNFKYFRNEQKDQLKVVEHDLDEDNDSDTRDDDDLEIIVHDESLTNNHQTKKLSSPNLNEANKFFDLKKQLEYYFSRQNLVNDSYLVSQMDEDSYVPITVIANFKRVREHTNGDMDLIVKTLRELSTVTVNDSGTKVKPNASLQPKRNTVIFRDVPDCTEDEMNQLLKDLNSPTVQLMKKDFGNMWYFTFETEEDALKLLTLVRGKDFKDQPIAARMKSEPVIRVYVTLASSIYPKGCRILNFISYRQTRTVSQSDINPLNNAKDDPILLNQHAYPPIIDPQYPYNQYSFHQMQPHKRHFSPRRQQYQSSYPRYDNNMPPNNNRIYERGGFQYRNKHSQMPYDGSRNTSARIRYNHSNNNNPKYTSKEDSQQQQEQQEQNSSPSPSLPSPIHASSSYSERRPYSPRYNNNNNYKYNNRGFNNNSKKYDNDQRQPFRPPRAVDTADRSANKDEDKRSSPLFKTQSIGVPTALSPLEEPLRQPAEGEIRQDAQQKKESLKNEDEKDNSGSIQQAVAMKEVQPESVKKQQQQQQATLKSNESAEQKEEKLQVKLPQQQPLDEPPTTDMNVNKSNKNNIKSDSVHRRSSNSTSTSGPSVSHSNRNEAINDNPNRRKRFGKYSKYKNENKRQEDEAEEEMRKKQPQLEVDLQPAHFPPLPNQQPSYDDSAVAAVMVKTTPSPRQGIRTDTRSAADVVKASMNNNSTQVEKECVAKQDKPYKKEQQEYPQPVKESSANVIKIQQKQSDKKDAVASEVKNSSHRKEMDERKNMDNSRKSDAVSSSESPVTLPKELEMKASFSWADMLKKK
ncbi:hypothetical protein BDF20DRAFT_882624 [Mycotypha africana]|uniref:uncharacterized protein n=1 Tax=Mycotypha africana TaxID=64632 RepID=UPI0023009F7C|nr:uncharacterized protein BDF20DRAFT_882624 [Mycotypha africana]KAI8973483.1 hypothetical protein BDF20DRAFT_882624 [Mycotypha africana]